MAHAISHGEALKLFQRWKELAVRVIAGFVYPNCFHGQFDGVVVAVEQNLLVVGASDGKNTSLQIDISKCDFVFPDVKGDSDAWIDAENPMMLMFPSGVHCTLIASTLTN